MKGATELAGQDSRRRTNLAHADADRGNLAVPHELKHPHVVMRFVRHGRQLDHVGVQIGESRVNLLQVFRRLAEVVHADNAFGLAVSRDTSGDFLFQVDILHAFGDRRPEQHQASFFRTTPLPLIVRPSTSGNYRTWAIPQ